MRDLCETLEVRTLFSATNISAVTAYYDAVVADASAIKFDFNEAVATYKADSKLVAADIKALGKNKVNSADISKLNKSVAGATALDSKFTNKIIATGKVALNRAKAAFVAEVSHPTDARAVKLATAVAALTTALAPYEATLSADAATGDASVDAALATLVAANPADTKLAGDVSLAQTSSSDSLDVQANELVNTNNDIDTLAAAVS